ncbi:nitroreductase family protein [Fodinicurvata sediminis]|uniref:nitroreductase family protein n=1 Tax=Fodinicurvata sediminis TaxID=1121832 RepID=UPI0003B3D278|nr:nitroreductase [Fodinicurvata sediminis]
MDAMTLLHGRRSADAKKLAEPAPNEEEMNQILAAGLTAPDHGALQPWRFFLITGPARERLGDLFVEATRAREPDMPAKKLEEQRGKPLRAPLIIAVGARIHADHPKVPVIEQYEAAMAAAQNMLLATEALGYGGVFLSGPNTYDAQVKSAFGLEEKDALAGFLYIGTPSEPLKPKRRLSPWQVTRTWTEPGVFEPLEKPTEIQG